MTSLEYQASEAHLLASARAQFRLMLGWRWAGILLLVLATAILFFVSEGALRWIAAFGLASGVVMAVMWVKTYLQFVSLARQAHRRLGDPTVRVDLSDRAIDVRSSIGSTTTHWEDVTRRALTRELVVLFAGKQPVASLPVSALTPEAVEIIERRTSGG